MPLFRIGLSLGVAASILIQAPIAQATERRGPNVILLLADDLGYADIGVYGAGGYQTPHLDQLAQRGVQLTTFHVASPVCSASRAAILTGCYPQRIGIPGVISANAKYGLHPDEMLLSELLRDAGYATAAFGKWHLGNQPELWPTRHGFDTWFGTIGSNDVGRGKPTLDERRLGKAGVELVDNDEVIEVNPDQRLLTRRYTEKAVSFIEGQGDSPFFLYLAYNMPHTPLFASERFRGTTERGLYGDVIAEIDWSVGQVVDALERTGTRDDTLIVFTSDNGPWLIFGDHGGSAAPYSGGKKQTLEGGMRVPCLISWPSGLPEGTVVDTFVSALDLFPTIAAATGTSDKMPVNDGREIHAVLEGAETGEPESPHRFFYYYREALHAVRSGHWKLRLPHIDREEPDPMRIGNGGERGETHRVQRELALFDLSQDPGERMDVSKQHPEKVASLRAIAEEARAELGDSVTGARGNGIRKPFRVTGSP